MGKKGNTYRDTNMQKDKRRGRKAEVGVRDMNEDRKGGGDRFRFAKKVSSLAVVIYRSSIRKNGA